MKTLTLDEQKINIFIDEEKLTILVLNEDGSVATHLRIPRIIIEALVMKNQVI